jgi:hypothetical protein
LILLVIQIFALKSKRIFLSFFVPFFGPLFIFKLSNRYTKNTPTKPINNFKSISTLSSIQKHQIIAPQSISFNSKTQTAIFVLKISPSFQVRTNLRAAKAQIGVTSGQLWPRAVGAEKPQVHIWSPEIASKGEGDHALELLHC